MEEQAAACNFTATDVDGVWVCAACKVPTPSSAKYSEPPFRQCPATPYQTRVQKTAVAETGPGTELGRILSKWGFHATETCDCKNFSRLMNSWGVDGCRERLESHIVPWLVEQFRKRKKHAEELGVIAKKIVDLTPEKVVPVLARRIAKKAIRRANAASSQDHRAAVPY